MRDLGNIYELLLYDKICQFVKRDFELCNSVYKKLKNLGDIVWIIII